MVTLRTDTTCYTNIFAPEMVVVTIILTLDMPRVPSPTDLKCGSITKIAVQSRNTLFKNQNIRKLPAFIYCNKEEQNTVKHDVPLIYQLGLLNKLTYTFIPSDTWN